MYDRMTREEIQDMYPDQYVGLRKVVWNQKLNNIESAEVAYAGMHVSALVDIMNNKERDLTIAFMGESSVHGEHKGSETKVYSAHFVPSEIEDIFSVAEILYDSEAEVFIAVNEEIGLVLEDSSYDQLVKRIKAAVHEMDKENGIETYSNIFKEVAR